MPKKKKSARKNARGNAEQIFAMKKFYIKLPDEAINYALSQLSREVRRKAGKNADKEKNILTALTMSAPAFASAVYEYQKSSIMLAEDTDYDDIIASYNSENCLMNTVFILKKCCDGTFDNKILENFLNSEEFKKTLSGGYGDYTEDEEEIEEKISESSEDKKEEPQESATPQQQVVVKEESRKNTSKWSVNYYIGNIEKRSTFYNFRPQYTLKVGKSGKKLEELYQIPEKFPLFGCINLAYMTNKRSREVLDSLDLKMVYAINCEDILEPNINPLDGTLNEIELKVDLQREFDTKRNSTTFFRRISDLRTFRIVRNEEYISDTELLSGEIIISDDFAKGELVLLHRMKDTARPTANDDISGPYKVDKKNGRTFIQPKVADERYLLNCYRVEKLSFGEIEEQEQGENPTSTGFAVLSDNSNYKKDIITDEVLIKGMFGDVMADAENIGEFMNVYKTSPFLAETLPSDIRNRRIERIRRIFSDIENYRKVHIDIAKTLINYYGRVDGSTKEMFSELIAESDDFKKLKKELDEVRADSKKSETPEKIYIKDDKELDEKNREIERLEKKITELEEKCRSVSACDSITQEIKNQQNIMKYLARENSKLEQANEELKEKIKATIQEKTSDIWTAFDPYISSAMLDAVGEWNRKQETEEYLRTAIYTSEKASECRHMDRKELCDYLVDYVRHYRDYSRNDILNMYICIAQGFLTVFSGLPGTGKTSICNIIGESLGLDSLGRITENISCNRFVSVSVEKGWSSKRDLIGYYNPLTQRYDKSNRRLYDSLMILNEEKENSALPFVVLLDEANLSPMEYYWADFMQIADRSEKGKSFINIGTESEIYIPDTLRFIATINNDQTTETLSPRLIDRAWIIKLPETDIKEQTAIDSRLVLWSDIVSAFDSHSMTGTSAENILKQITELFRTYGMAVSPRTLLSMRKYISSAREVMEGTGNISSDSVALDYAVMQKLLPKISGHVKIYRDFFDELIRICTANGLDMTKGAVMEMQKESARNMGYCRYLS
ncbi:MAG: hypothetical protein K2J08_05075 [Ruminococcus sp.]|nr:hypothetical protein [Ruminococcus sp.]